MSIPVYTAAGSKQSATATLPKATELSAAAVTQTLLSRLANEDRGRALVKTRGAVRGGGKKPWRQKGTGRARAGTSSSPIWRGGGITFGPDGRSRTYRRVNRKTARAALLGVLAALAKDSRLKVLAGKPALAATKDAGKLLSKLEMSAGLVVVTTEQLADAIGCRNLDGVDLTSTRDLTTVDLLRSRQVLISETALAEVLGKTPTKAAPRRPTPSTNRKPA